MTAVLVHIDLDGEDPHPSSLLALAAGRNVASSWGATLYAALVVHEPFDKIAPDSTVRLVPSTKLPRLELVQTALARGGADKVIVATSEAPVAPLWAAVGNPWSGVVDHLRPRLVLFGADAPSAIELAPRTGARIGARLLVRARAIGLDDVELRDRDGAYVRMSDSGAAVCLISRAELPARGDDDVDLVVLAVPGAADARIEIVGRAPAQLAHTASSIVVLTDEAARDSSIVKHANRIASYLGAPLAGGPSAVRANVIAPQHALDRTVPLAPDLCVTVGNPSLDLAGTTRLVKIGAQGGKLVDGALPGPTATAIAELTKRLEDV